MALSVGGLLGAALIAGQLTRKLHLPSVTAYLLVGLALGPHTPLIGLVEWISARLGQSVSLDGWHIPDRHLELLEPVGKFAIALVLFNVGCRFPLANFRRILKRLLPISLGELTATMVLVTGGLWLLGGLQRHAELNWQTAALFGALALATAPATTVLVFKESRSEGPLTEFATGLVALNNLASVVIFEVLFVLVHATRDAKASIAVESLELTRNLFAAGMLGMIAGVVVSFFCGMVPPTRWLVLLTAVIAPLMAVCELLHVPYLLTFLTMGVSVASTSDVADDVCEALDRLTGLLCVVFFVIHGAEMDLNKLWASGAVGAAYIALRSAGKYFGVYFTADPHRDGPATRRWLGATLLSQAGAAIALSAIAVERDKVLGEQLQHVILGTVVFFELAGPIMVRVAVLRAGEVPVSAAIFHTASSPVEQLRSIAFRVMQACGVDPLHGKSADQWDVGRVTSRNVKPLSAVANFDQVLDHLEHSHDNTYPVVTEANVLIGVIRYPDVRDVIFEPSLKSLVTALDMAMPAKKVLKQNDTLSEAWRMLKDSRDDCIPVVTAAQPYEYLGVVRRRSLLRLMGDEALKEEID